MCKAHGFLIKILSLNLFSDLEFILEKEKSRAVILVVSDNSVNKVGGEQKSTIDVCTALAEFAHVVLACPGEQYKGIEHCQFIHVSTSKQSLLRDLIVRPVELLRYVGTLIRLFRKLKPDYVHTQSQLCFLVFSLLFSVSQRHGAKFFHTDRALRSKYGRFVSSIMKWAVHRLDCLIATTELNKRLWKESLGERGPNIVVVRNTVGTMSCSEVEVKEIVGRPLKIGFSGRMVDWKGWDLAADLIGRVSRDGGFDAHFLVAAAVNNQRETECVDGFISDISSLEVTVELNKNLSSVEMEKFYERLDFFVVTSLPGTESFGRTVIESMGKGVVVFTTNCGGPVEIVGDNSFVFESSSDFCLKFKKYIESGRYSSDRLENAKRVRDLYSFERFKSDLNAVYGGGE